MTPLPLVRYAILVVAVALLGVRADAQQPSTTDVSLDSLLNTHISAASKYAQTSNAAPGSVTIVSSEDIRAYGYRNLQEVLEKVRGFYVTSDRTFSSLGTRGFNRTTDYNSRVLLLIDGHAIGDLVAGATPLGADLPLDLNVVERIEIVQGPGSALYGTGAMFGVINVVTKTALALDGGIARVGIGSVGERVASLAGGHVFGSGVSLTGSGLLTNTTGGDHYYREFDTPATHHGIARGLDWQHGLSGHGTLKWSGLTVQAGYREHKKGIPTAPFGTTFGDSRAHSNTRSFWGDVGLQHAWSGTINLSGRLFADRSAYEGVFPFDDALLTQTSGSTSVGTELMLRWEPISRLRVTIGTEDRFVTTASYSEQVNAYPASSDNAPFHVLSAFAQGEVQVLPSAMLVTGARVDRYSTVGSATTPRLGLILTPHAATTVKLLYGEAFRAPSAAQASLTAGVFVENPNLKPERIATTEINVQQRLGSAFLLDVAAYRYVVRDLIDLTLAPGSVVYQNLSAAKASGLEFQLEARPVGPISAQLSYAFQHADDGQDSTLTNSPGQVANLNVTARSAGGLHGAVQFRHESGRRTLATTSTSPFLRTDANVGYRPGPRSKLSILENAEIALRVTNVFDTPYAMPFGALSRQNTIAADGRTYALRLEWRY